MIAIRIAQKAFSLYKVTSSTSCGCELLSFNTGIK